MKRSADWIAWILQFLLGLAVGIFVGAFIISKGRRSGGGFWLLPEAAPFFLVGAALAGGALASYHGDRLWLGHSYRVIAPDGMRHDRASRAASCITGAAGIALMVAALLMHFGLRP